jgi:hypothetical protein
MQARSERKLICEGCGCTDDNACPGGCHWISLKPPVCSRCVPSGELPNALDAAGGGDGITFGGERCPASHVPALHIPLWTSETEGYCTRCYLGFVT